MVSVIVLNAIAVSVIVLNAITVSVIVLNVAPFTKFKKILFYSLKIQPIFYIWNDKFDLKTTVVILINFKQKVVFTLAECNCPRLRKWQVAALVLESLGEVTKIVLVSCWIRQGTFTEGEGSVRLTSMNWQI